MEDELNCGNCEHWVEGDGTEHGICNHLTDVDMETEPDVNAGAIDIFYCKPEFYCSDHSENETDEQIDDDAVADDVGQPLTPEQASPEPQTQPQRAQDYLS